MEIRQTTRPPVKQDGIVADLRARILDRTYRPGARLPTRTELQASFQASSVTVQRALDRLVTDGFVQARGRHGTFVVEHPPSSCHYALVVPLEPDAGGWVRFWTALVNEARRVGSRQPRTMSVYHGIDGHTDAEDYQRLLRDLRNQRLAGIVFAVNPRRLFDTPLIRLPGIPRIAISDQADRGLMALRLDRFAFIDRALDHFLAKGRRRVAVVAVPGQEDSWRERLHAALAERGMIMHPHWWQVLSQAAPQSARGVVRLLMHEGQRERPDALLISDDNLVEHATAGLVAAGARVPEDVEVVAHCNFPWPTPSVLPVARLGYDAREVLDRCLRAIDDRRSGVPGSDEVDVPVRFEREVRVEDPSTV